MRTLHADGGGVACPQRRLLSGEEVKTWHAARARCVLAGLYIRCGFFCCALAPAGWVMALMQWHCCSAEQLQGALAVRTQVWTLALFELIFSCTLARSAGFCVASAQPARLGSRTCPTTSHECMPPLLGLKAPIEFMRHVLCRSLLCRDRCRLLCRLCPPCQVHSGSVSIKALCSMPSADL